MDHSPGKPTVALIAGPTASGKSALALRLAEASGGVIVNADASQLYRDLRILSARPDATEEARAPHRLFGTRDGADPASAADWAALARREIMAAHDAGRPAILVGGTGLYLRALIDGIAPVPPIDPPVRAAVRALPVSDASAALRQEDPRAADRLNPADTTRIARALEVVRSTGRTLASWQADRTGGMGDCIRLLPIVLMPDRDVLRARCATRFAAMLDAGAADEVAALTARGLPSDLPVMRAIGVREIAAWQAGTIDRVTMLDIAINATRRYAKRQYTWFRHQLPSDWPRTDPEQMLKHETKLRSRLLTR